MKRNKFFDAKKEFFALEEKLDANDKAQRALGYIELDKPRFAGYQKALVLRADIANRDDAHVFKEIIDRFQHKVRSRKKDFVAYDWRTRRKYVMSAGIGNITVDEYEKLSPQVKKHFSVDTSTRNMIRGRYTYSCNVPSFYFDQKVSKYYITKVKVIDSDLIREEAELEWLISVNPLYRKFKGGWRNRHIYTAPKWYRRDCNRREKMKAKHALYKFLKTGEEFDLSPNYKDGNNYW